MRVVLDTNVLMSALLFKGRLSRIYTAIEYGEITLCFTVKTFTEFAQVIQREKFTKTLHRHRITPQEVVEFVLKRSVIKDTPDTLPVFIPEDRADDHILSAAALGSAACIVSGDAHITRLGVFQGIPVLTPKQFLAAL